ncbi:MAG: type II toxin-antitoxin system RelE/ParE family toxin [Deltaproteobacteria bacterium]|nr:type II toxin-antitoxin system RelE/ParE family toxin [Deltaproteobacteria bacterium]
MVIIETPIFTRQVTDLLEEDEYRDLQGLLAMRPESGSVIPNGGGLRKIRWSMAGRGKRGGVRVIYYWVTKLDTILMLFMYPKNKKDNLTAKELKILRQIIEEEYHG